MSKDEIDNIVARHLQVGSSEQELIEFFEHRRWLYSFDRHLNRYQARNPAEDRLPESLGRNQVYIYLDAQRTFVRAEIEKVFNSM